MPSFPVNNLTCQPNHQLDNYLRSLFAVMAVVNGPLPCSLLDLLSNDLILRHTSPYIGKSLVSLAATSKAYQSLVYDTPQVFQHVDLTRTHVLMGDARVALVDVEKFDKLYYSQRFRTIFTVLENRNVLQDVRTLILDDLVVPGTVIEDILSDERCQIRLLSVRNLENRPTEAVQRILRQLIRPSRPKGTPKLRGLYWFGQSSRSEEVHNLDEFTKRHEAIGVGVTASMGAQLGAGNRTDDDLNDFQKLSGEDPYSQSPYSALGMSNAQWGNWVISEWSEILEECRGLIHFDAVLCRHEREIVLEPGPHLATVRLSGCASCGTCPEGSAYPGVSPADHLPLLSPPPLHSSKVEVAQRLNTNGQPYPPLILRCRTCLKDRWCESCNIWWCESCYTMPLKNKGIAKGHSASIEHSAASNENIKVLHGLCTSKCLMDELLNGVGEGGMWG